MNIFSELVMAVSKITYTAIGSWVDRIEMWFIWGAGVCVCVCISSGLQTFFKPLASSGVWSSAVGTSGSQHLEPWPPRPLSRSHSRSVRVRSAPLGSVRPRSAPFPRRAAGGAAGPAAVTKWQRRGHWRGRGGRSPLQRPARLHRLGRGGGGEGEGGGADSGASSNFKGEGEKQRQKLQPRHSK